MSKSKHKKISRGYVVQVYEDLECVEQRFVADNDVDYTSMSDVPLPSDTIMALNEHEVYCPFNMVQPQITISKLDPEAKEMFQKHLLFYLTRYPEDLIDQLCDVVMAYPEFAAQQKQQEGVDDDNS